MGTYATAPGQTAQRWSQVITSRWEDLAEELRARLGPGSGLDPRRREVFERRLGRDLSGAVIHRSSLAERLAGALGADALSTGAHILGGQAQPDPATPTGAALLGHELT